MGKKKCLILPDDPWKLRWNIFLVVVIWVSSVITPIDVAFLDHSIEGMTYWETA